MIRRKKELTAPNVFEFQKAQSIVVSGDIHGDFTQLVFKCCVQYDMTDTLIIRLWIRL